jgi:CubicO group peptidase (beta-lactamase class C family)
MMTLTETIPSPIRRLLLEATEVPRDLSAVTTIATRQETDPEAVGMSRPGVESIWRAVERVYASGMHPGISLVVRRHGQIVLKRAIGHASGNGPGDATDTPPVLMTPDTPVCLYSASKAIAAMTVHLLSERKQLSLLDPVSHYIPAFGQNGKREITIYQLLCHKAGIPTIPLEGEIDVAELLLDQQEVLRRIYAAAPEKPGHHHAYHALTAGFVIADLVEKVSGQGFRDFFKEQVSGPLGLKTLDFGMRGRAFSRLARNYVSGFRYGGAVNAYLRRAIGTTLEKATEISNDPRFYRAVIPAGNGVATADDSGRFFQCLLDGGQLEGRRAFKPLTVRRAIAEVGKPEVDRSLLVPLRYSAGMMLGAKPFGLYGPDTSRAFGHLGFANNFVWADPERATSISLLATGKVILGLHAPYLVALLCALSRHCPKLSEHEQQRHLEAAGMC